jgi:hypothetical protein
MKFWTVYSINRGPLWTLKTFRFERGNFKQINHFQLLTRVSIAWVAVSFSVTRGNLRIPNPSDGKKKWVMRCRYCRLLHDHVCWSLNVSQFATSCSFSNGTERSLRDLTWFTGTSDDCRAIETYKIRDVRALGQDFSSERWLVQRQTGLGTRFSWGAGRSCGSRVLQDVTGGELDSSYIVE